MSAQQIKSTMMFGLPVWQVSVPEFAPHHPKIVKYLEERFEGGGFKAHKYGYGYQTKEDMYSPSELSAHPHFSILKNAFLKSCDSILNTNSDHGIRVKMDHEINKTQAWILLQTQEGWDLDPWHNHYPAVLSASYCVQMPKVDTRTEGRLLFKNPGAPSIFTDEFLPVLPEEGTMTIFPSFLDHRPTPCPSADKWRITINMDAFIAWKQARK